MNARFPTTAPTREVARRYYRERAVQGLSTGWRLDALTDLPYGVEAALRSPEGVAHRSVFVLEGQVGRGHLTRWFETRGASHPFVTSTRCPAMVSWLDRKGYDYSLVPAPTDPCYLAAEAFYGDGRARRSGRFFTAHVDEGLFVLDRLGAPMLARRAFCLHPLVQSDADLQTTLASALLDGLPADAVALAMEYRWRANAHLPKHTPKVPLVGPIEEIRLMLVADKIQNRKDFERYVRHHPEVPNRSRLDAYFREWFDVLGIDELEYRSIVDDIVARTLQSAATPVPILAAQKAAPAAIVAS